MCTHVSKFGKVLKTHTIRNNSHNKAGRQLQFTSEVTLIGAHIVSKFQPNPTIIVQVIDHFVQRQLLSRPSPFNTIVWQIALKLTHMSISFKTIVLVYFQHNGRTAHIPTAHIPLALRGPTDSLLGVEESHHPCVGSVPISPKRDGMPALLVSWALKASSIGSTLRSPQTKMPGSPQKTYSQPSQIL